MEEIVVDNEDILEQNANEIVTEKEVVAENEVRIQRKDVPEKTKLVRLPLGRVKHIIKMDPEHALISQASVFAVTKATELFVELLTRESVKYTQASKRKTVSKRDIESAIEDIPQLCFLEETL